MLRQNIDALKLTNALIDMQREDDCAPRMSLLDLQIFMTIHEHPHNGKSGLLEIINGSTTSKSFLDRPISRLQAYRLIDRTDHENAATVHNQARVTYCVSKEGLSLLNKCRVSRQGDAT